MGNTARSDAQAARRGYQPMLVICAAMSAGIAGDRYASLGLFGSLAVATGFWLAWWLARRAAWQRVAALLLLGALAATAAAWHHHRWRCFAWDELGRAATDEARPICLQAVFL